MKTRHLAFALAAACVVVAVACAPEPPPDLDTRPTTNLGNPDTPPDSPDLTNSELPPDAGHVEYDGGECCVVDFALLAASDERRADLTLYPSMQQFSMELDAGVWRVSACVPLRAGYYYYAVGLATNEEDGGLFPWTRVSPLVESVPNEVVPMLNVFDPGDAGACGDFDGGVYGEVPDAG